MKFQLSWVLAAVVMKLFYDSDTSGLLIASMGVVLPKPGSTPERNRVQSALRKKKVLFRRIGPPAC